MSEQAERQALTAANGDQSGIEVFGFGDDVSVVDGRSLWDYFEGAWMNGRWYEPPVPFLGLAKSFRMSPHHQSAIKLKVNLLKRHFIPSRWLSAAEHERAALDFLQMGNMMLQAIPNLAGRPLRYEVAPALYTRVGVEPGTFFWVRPDELGYSTSFNDYEFPKGSIVHIREPDVVQEIYGLPGWLSALNSGLLNESATLFRRRYYKNGAHAGFVFYMSETGMNDEDVKKIREQMRQAKGIGNFKNLFIHAPNGKKDGVKIIPIAEVAAKDEFLDIKNVTRDDMLASHRTPPQLIGIIPMNAGGFSDPRTAMDVFFPNEIEPLMASMKQVNDITGLQVIDYLPYQAIAPSTAPGGAGQGGGR